MAVEDPVTEFDELAVLEADDEAERVLESVGFDESVLEKRHTGAERTNYRHARRR